MFFNALCDLIPAARDAVLTASVVTREHAATFRGSPGIESLRPTVTTSIPGLFVAGAWCSTGWPATMEGAVRSGNDAAAGILRLFSNSSRADPQDRERVNT